MCTAILIKSLMLNKETHAVSARAASLVLFAVSILESQLFFSITGKIV